jgi:hypothetical protein
VRQHCSFYLGWRDNCDGCIADPAKWGRVQGTECQDGGGDDNICYTPFLDGKWVPLFGLNTDGNVNGDDKFYFGMRCDEAPAATAQTQGPCPAGMLMTGIAADRSVHCASPGPQVQPVVRESCALYGGWRDSCDACTDPPAKWGQARHGQCELGIGSDSQCMDLNLDGQAVSMLAINTDGDVNGDDKFYLGWQCFQADVEPPQ